MQRILITGANRGLGLGFVRHCLSRGDMVLACARHPEQADALQSLQREHGDRLILIPLDVADEASIAEAHRIAGEQIDGLDLLVNNAGINEGSRDAGGYRQNMRLGSIAPEAMLHVLQVNTVAPLMVAQAFLDLLHKGSHPRIVSISSGLGSIARAGGGYYSYATSKAGLNMVMRQLAMELRGDGIISVLFSPGWVRTDMGGGGAPVGVEESVSGMMRTIDGLTMAQTGQFLNWKDGNVLEW